MYSLTFEKRVWLVKHRLKGDMTSKIALAQGVSERTVQNLVKTYNEFGWDGLKDHKTGRPETVLNKNVEVIILDLRNRFGYGACHIEEILRKKGFGISHRQIEKLLVRNSLVLPNFDILLGLKPCPSGNFPPYGRKARIPLKGTLA